MPQTPAQRRAVANAKKRAKGLVRVEVWATPTEASKIRRFAAELSERRTKREKA